MIIFNKFQLLGLGLFAFSLFGIYKFQLLGLGLFAFSLFGICSCSRVITSEQKERLQQLDHKLPEPDAKILHKWRSSPVDQVEFRIRELSYDHLDQGNGAELQARIPIANPWTLHAKKETQGAVIDRNIAQLEDNVLSQDVLICNRSIEALSNQQKDLIYQQWSKPALQLLEWNQALIEANGINRLTALELTLRLRRELLQRQPKTTRALPSERFPLPSLKSHIQFLDTPEQVRILIIENHPKILENISKVNYLEGLAHEKNTEQIPWLNFVQFGYPVRSGNNLKNLELALAIEIPLGINARNEKTRYKVMAQYEWITGEMLTRKLLDQTMDCLDRLNAFSDKLPTLTELNQNSDSAEEIALQWFDDRQGDPEQIAQVLDQIYKNRLLVFELREQWGHSQCELLSFTGVSPAQWPKQ